MNILFLLIPLTLVLLMAVAWDLFWSINTGQFDDLEGPAHGILLDDEESPSSGP